MLEMHDVELIGQRGFLGGKLQRPLMKFYACLMTGSGILHERWNLVGNICFKSALRPPGIQRQLHVE